MEAGRRRALTTDGSLTFVSDGRERGGERACALVGGARSVSATHVGDGEPGGSGGKKEWTRRSAHGWAAGRRAPSMAGSLTFSWPGGEEMGMLATTLGWHVTRRVV